MAKFKLLSTDEIHAMLRKLPHDLKLDILQFGLDMVGLVNPAADVANAAISIWRGDFLGAAIGIVSIIPVGDVVKILKLGDYAKSIGTLVYKVVPKDPVLYKELEPMMVQFRTLIAKIPGGNPEIEKIRDAINNFFKNAEKFRLGAGVKGVKSWAAMAKKRGKWAENAYAKFGTSVDDVVERLANAVEGSSTSLRMNAKHMIEQMGRRDWLLTAGPHKTSKTAGKFKDKTEHITMVFKDADDVAFHLRLDKQGHIFEIRTVVKEGGKSKAVNPVDGTPRYWQGPGQ